MMTESIVVATVREYSQFFKLYFSTNGAPQVLVLSLLLSLGMFCIVGIVPDIVGDRYARLNHGYNGVHCSTFGRADKPQACQNGADDAQAAAALASLVRNVLSLMSTSIVGSISDVKGRKNIMVCCMFLYIFVPGALILIQLIDSLNPLWFYIADSLTGLVNYMAIPLTMLSDIMPEHLRGPSFGLFLSAFYVGFSVAPSLPLLLDHFYVAIVSFCLMVFGFAFALFALPETLPQQVAERNRSERQAVGDNEENAIVRIAHALLRPFKEMSILNRNQFFRLLSLGAFFSGLVYGSDATLVIYYVEDQLNVRDRDLARMFLVMGLVGIVIQSQVQLLMKVFGQYGLTVTSFFCGVIHNLLYGLAKEKSTIYVAFCLSQLTKVNFPMLTSYASINADITEQGQIQGALLSLMAAANALGPIILQSIYDQTKDRRPGTMWDVASLLYFVGFVFVCLLPRKKVESSQRDVVQPVVENEQDLQEPLLDATQP